MKGLRTSLAAMVAFGAFVAGGVSHAQWRVRPELAFLAPAAQREGEALLASVDDHQPINFLVLNDTCELSVSAPTDPTGRTNTTIWHTGRVENMSVAQSGAYLEFRSSVPLESTLTGGYGPEVKRNNRYGFGSMTRYDPSNFITMFNQMVEICRNTQ